MKKYFRVLVILTGILLWTVFSGFVIYKYFCPRIAYVKNGKLLAEAKYMTSVSRQLEKEMSLVQANVDTLKNRYETLKQNVKGSNNDALTGHLALAENNYFKYLEKARNDMSLRQKEVTEQALNKINSVIKAYAEQNGYDYILGTSSDGNILFGNEKDDVTDLILKEVNNSFDKENQPVK